MLPGPKEDDYAVNWPDLLPENERTEAEVGEIKAKTIKAYIETPGADMIIPPEIFLEKIMHYDKDEIAKITTILGVDFAGIVGEE